ncbi:MAG: ATP-binding protein [Bacteroidales bacterium]|nr:ATP-binding protein [Bacteroidales bacterium]
MATNVKYPIGIQDFEGLRKDGYIYVDKTGIIRKLIEEGKYYFLSRPRRFGKSLLLSTIRAYFEGKRELFKGLAIDTDEESWEAHPVLHLDLNSQKYDSKESLDGVLDDFLSREEAKYEIVKDNDYFGLRFCNLIRKAYEQTGQRVVILIDEYDKPMLQAIGKPELQDAFRNTLKGFYGALKTMDGSIQFALLTGVTKFGKVSVFSDLNHLVDLSLDARYYNICGISEEEIHHYFKEGVQELAAANGMTEDECYALLKERYDGYHFEESAPGMYNPFSLLQTLVKQKFGSYWFETGTPTYLVTLLQMHDYNLESMAEVETDADVLNSTDGGSTDPIPVIYQSGYLTIKGYDKEFGLYKLGFPNKEVEEGFMKFLVPFYTNIPKSSSAFEITQFVKDVRAGRTEQFIKRLRSFFAGTPYELVKDLENHYQNVLFIIARLMGIYTRTEYHTSEGRIDMVILTKDYCYVLEFKLNGTAEEALQQIQDKHYTLPFEMDGQHIVRIGMNFSSETRNIDGVAIG